MSKLHLIGIDGRPLTPAAVAAIRGAVMVFGSERFRPFITDFGGELQAITPLAAALARMAEALDGGDIAVLASGDPLFFGIGRRLGERFGRARLTVHPALSTMQLAFARLGEPWDDAALLSLHGRNGGDLLATLIQRGKVFLFTDPRRPPHMIAAELDRGLAELGINDHDCRILVAENLGLAEERLIEGSPKAIMSQRFAEPNVMILRLDTPPLALPACRLGLCEQEIQHSRGLITKDEVRAAVLHQLRLPEGGVLWDVGAGSGSVSVEACRLCPGLTVYAVERNPDEQANILANRRRFRLANLHLVAGPAPDALAALPGPDRVFLGGSGGKLAAIVELAATRLKGKGRLVVSAVTEATRALAPELLHQQGLTVELCTIAVQRAPYPPRAAGERTLNPITLITGSK